MFVDSKASPSGSLATKVLIDRINRRDLVSPVWQPFFVMEPKGSWPQMAVAQKTGTKMEPW